MGGPSLQTIGYGITPGSNRQIFGGQSEKRIIAKDAKNAKARGEGQWAVGAEISGQKPVASRQLHIQSVPCARQDSVSAPYSLLPTAYLPTPLCYATGGSPRASTRTAFAVSPRSPSSTLNSTRSPGRRPALSGTSEPWTKSSGRCWRTMKPKRLR